MRKTLYSAGILGVSAVVPSQVRKNDYWRDIRFDSRADGKNPFKGIEERRVFPDNLLPSDVEAEVGRRALRNANLSPDEIDLVMVQSMVPDEILPENACLVQYKLGLKNAGAWTIDTCCSSFVTAIVSAANLIATGEFKKILIINSALCSRHADKGDYLSVVLGDAAGAIVMGVVADDKGYLASFCTSHGEYHQGFTVKIRQPYFQDELAPEAKERKLLTYNYDVTKRVGRHSIEDMKFVLNKVLEKSQLRPEQIDLFLSHQPCYWAHEAWRDCIGIKPEKSYQTFKKYGNIGSATIPVNLFEAVSQGMLKEGSYLLMASAGAGKNEIAAVLRWGR